MIYNLLLRLLGIKPAKPKKTVSAVRLRKGDVYKDDTIIGVKYHWDSEQVTITRSDGSIGTFDFNQDMTIDERK